MMLRALVEFLSISSFVFTAAVWAAHFGGL